MRENDGRKLDHRTLEVLRLRAVEQVRVIVLRPRCDFTTPWSSPLPGRLTPAQVRRGFRNLRKPSATLSRHRPPHLAPAPGVVVAR